MEAKPLSEHHASFPSLVSEGTILNERYEIGRLIGQGGFAAVYEAYDELIGRPVAVKVLNVYTAARDEGALATILRRFSTEARAAAMIDHPNVVKIFDMGVIEALQLPFIVMELLNGHDLDLELDRGPMAPRRALDLVERCLEALAVGHDQGIIHKDLKPANIFITHPGTEREDVRILDFGTARLQNQGSGVTAAGEVLGTPQYLAPEYISKQIVTPALDVYQVGLILVEMLTGAPVVDSDNPLACLMAHSSGELHIDNLLLKGELGRVLSVALDFDHTRRYSDAGEFLLALRAVDVTRVSIGGARVRLSRADPRRDPSPPAEASDDLMFGFEPAEDAATRAISTVEERPDWLSDDPFDFASSGASAPKPAAPALKAPEPRRAADPPRRGAGRRDPTSASTTTQSASTARASRQWLMPVVAALALFVLIGGVTLALTWDRAPSNAPPLQPLLPAPTEADRPAPVIKRPERRDDGQISVGLISEPTAATIKDGDAVLGQTPMTLYLDPKRPHRKISISLEGHASQTLTITEADAPMKVITLKP